MSDLRAANEWEPAQPEIAQEKENILSYMSFVWGHPSLTALEVGWRWLFGVPFLLVLWGQWQQILLRIPPESVGWNHLNAENPFASSAVLANVASAYRPALGAMLVWLAPVALVLWSVVSGIGRTRVLHRMRRLSGEKAAGGISSALPGMIVLQAAWMVALLGCFWLWDRGVWWAAEAHLLERSDPDLLGFLLWLIFFSLALYTAWALLSWTLGVAPVLMTEEHCSPLRAVLRSFRLGKRLSSQLAEMNLVMGIVKIALIVLAMVFCAAPLPFSDQFGESFMHGLYVVIALLYLAANDYFQVVRLRSFVRLRRRLSKLTSVAPRIQINRHPTLKKDFIGRILNEYEEVWLSDESSLWDFSMNPALDDEFAKIQAIYGVDVTDIDKAIIWKIIDRIARSSPFNRP